MSIDRSAPAVPVAPLFVPGNREKLMDSARRMRLDGCIIDLEDAVPAAEKAAARVGARGLIADLRGGRTFVRVNPFEADTGFSTPCGAEDIAAVVVEGLIGVILPKIEHVAQAKTADAALARAEAAAGLAVGSVALGVIVETALGVVRSVELACASVERPLFLLFGMGDLTNDLGIDWTRLEDECLTARSMLVLAARAARRGKPLDSAYPRIADLDGLRHSAREGRRLGYGGKAAIHPTQVAVIRDAYRPSDDEVRWAQRVIDAAAEHTALGAGSFTLDGRMIDEPIVASAHTVLRLHRELA